MNGKPVWSRLPAGYRTREMTVLSTWIAAGESGSVLGLPGVGRSTFLDYLGHRPGVLRRYLPESAASVAVLPVDLNNLPDNQLATLYRVILRSFYEAQGQFDPPVRRTIRDLFAANRARRDPFMTQTGLRELLLLFRSRGTRVTLILNRFDDFCREATPRMTRTLLGLRDSFKTTLTYIAGMRQEVVYLSDIPAIDPLHHLLDAHVCWIGPMAEDDGRNMIERHTRQMGGGTLEEAQVRAILALTAGFPSLIRIICQGLFFYRSTEAASLQEPEWWFQQPEVQHRLGRLWEALTQEEQRLLAEVRKWQTQQDSAEGLEPGLEEKEQEEGLQRLAEKGVCRHTERRWEVAGALLGLYAGQMAGRSRGRVWIEAETGQVFQGSKPIDDLQPLERAVLEHFLEQPYGRHTYTEIINAAWPAEVARDGVSNDALYQIIRKLRVKLEPDPGHPRYVINWRGTPEGGYQFYPEGRPA